MTRSRRRLEARTQTPPQPAADRPHVLQALHERVRELVLRRPVALALGLALLHVGLGLLTFEPRPHTGGDNAAYISLATSLLERGAYVELWDPGEPPHTKYPPAFPAVLAVAMALGLKPFVQLKLVVLALSAGAVAFSFLWMRARGRPALALAAGVLLAMAPGVLREGRWILSDVPFWCFTMVALWAFERLRPDDRVRFGVGALAVLLAYFTRSAGLPLVIAAAGWLAWRRHWKQLGALAVIVGVPALAWWLRGRAFGPAGYVSEFWLINPYDPSLGTIGAGDLFDRIADNIGRYTSIHLPILIAGARSVLLNLVSLAVVVLAFAGWLRRALQWRELRVADIFLPLYLGLIFVWPAVWSGERFLLPALALLLLFAGDSLVALSRRVGGRYALATAAAVAVLMALLTLPALATAAATGRTCTALYRAGDRYACMPGVHWRDFFELAEWTAGALPDHAVLLSRKPRLYYVLSGQKSANYPLSYDVGDFFAAVQQTGARYVVFDRLDAVSDAYLMPVLMERPHAFCVIRALEPSGTVLFGILPTPAEATSQSVADAEGGFEVCGDEYWRSAQTRRQLTSPQ